MAGYEFGFLMEQSLSQQPAAEGFLPYLRYLRLPTFGDCLPMVLAEAGASGMPIISTVVL